MNSCECTKTCGNELKLKVYISSNSIVKPVRSVLCFDGISFDRLAREQCAKAGFFQVSPLILQSTAATSCIVITNSSEAAKARKIVVRVNIISCYAAGELNDTEVIPIQGEFPVSNSTKTSQQPRQERAGEPRSDHDRDIYDCSSH